MAEDTVFQRLKKHASGLTRLERRLADAISSNYPVSGLGSITALAAKANVSSPTVARLVQKLGFSGFPEFQQSLREELDKELSNRMSDDYSWATNAPDTHAINSVTEAAILNIRNSVKAIDFDDFESMCDMLCDLSKSVYFAGGTITGTLANHLFVYMQVMRPDVHILNSDRSHWLHEMMNVGPSDVVVLYHVRQYEKRVINIANQAIDRGADVILITDQWKSPISSVAKLTFNGRIAMPSGMDSTISLFLFNEIITATVKQKLGNIAIERGNDLEEIFSKARWFK